MNGQKNLVLILARELASKLATPMFITDAEGNLVFYNEPAEVVLGRTFAEVGELSAEQWSTLFRTEDVDRSPLPLERLPGGIALREQRPAQGVHRIIGLDGTARLISVTALPLLAGPEEFVGMVAIFWEEREPAAG